MTSTKPSSAPRRAAEEQKGLLSIENNAPASVLRMTFCVIIAAAILLTVTDLCVSDTVIRKDGTKTRGRVISNDNEMVVLETGTDRAVVRMNIPKKDVRAVIKDNWKPAPSPKKPTKSTTKGVPSGPGYYPIPIIGEIGTDVEARYLKVALANAKKAKSDIVVLYIDSPGGSVEETKDIIALLGANQDMRIVACVRQALSAAAIIAMSCKEIYMLPGSTIGAAVPYQVAKNGTIKPIEAKLKSAIHAQFRTAAELGGHDPLLVEAMVDPNVQVVLTESKSDGKRILARTGKGKVIKAKGQILTLTPNEAAECGLSSGTGKTMESLNEAIGLKSWHRVKGRGWALMTMKAVESRRKREREEKKSARAACLAKIKPQLDAIGQQIAKAKSDTTVARREKALLKKTYAREVTSINADYNRDRRRGATLGAIGRYQEAEYMKRQATIARDNKFSSLRRSYEPKVTALKLRIKRNSENIKNLDAKRNKLISDAKRAAKAG